jgi:23S rRNA (cytidine1920-2'-O)/16S rRNA (cytidine1409-2'-O)-methyltransferase
MPSLMRADLLLVERGLANSRTAAQNLIDAQRVWIELPEGRSLVNKSSQKLADDIDLFIVPDPADRFVSRGGLKMQGALDHVGLDVTGLRVLDLGISTGGFSDCLLQAGAASIVGVDVGHSQLAPKLANDSRVSLFEGVNARHLQAAELGLDPAQPAIDMIVIDVSFISLKLVLPAAIPLLRPGGHLLSLVKPQFEVGREGLSKGGIVKDEKLYQHVQRNITDLCQQLGLQVKDFFDSSIKGGDGNREFFVFAGKPDH